jgi:hypothetical protein
MHSAPTRKTQGSICVCSAQGVCKCVSSYDFNNDIENSRKVRAPQLPTTSGWTSNRPVRQVTATRGPELKCNVLYRSSATSIRNRLLSGEVLAGCRLEPFLVFNDAMHVHEIQSIPWLNGMHVAFLQVLPDYYLKPSERPPTTSSAYPQPILPRTKATPRKIITVDFVSNGHQSDRPQTQRCAEDGGGRGVWRARAWGGSN